MKRGLPWEPGLREVGIGEAVHLAAVAPTPDPRGREVPDEAPARVSHTAVPCRKQAQRSTLTTPSS